MQEERLCSDELFSGFEGFSNPRPNGKNTDYFPMPNEWITISAAIDNLAELKIVEYIMRHTWGFQDYQAFKHITIDEFISGRKRRDGSRIDSGTGLSKPSVIAGITKALKHGLIECEVDDGDLAKVKKYYKLRIYHPQEEAKKPDVTYLYPDVKSFDMGVKNVDIQEVKDVDRDLSKDTEERHLEERKAIRIPSPPIDFSEEVRLDFSVPESQKKRQRVPVFIQWLIADFSSQYGDGEHTRSNISQANNIYHASGMSEQEFTDAIYAAIAAAKQASIKKLNARGRPNRIPYFFKCLIQLAVRTATG